VIQLGFGLPCFISCAILGRFGTHFLEVAQETPSTNCWGAQPNSEVALLAIKSQSFCLSGFHLSSPKPGYPKGHPGGRGGRRANSGSKDRTIRRTADGGAGGPAGRRVGGHLIHPSRKQFLGRFVEHLGKRIEGFLDLGEKCFRRHERNTSILTPITGPWFT